MVSRTVGGPIPSLATTNSVVYGPSATPFHSAPKFLARRNSPVGETRNWNGSVVRPLILSLFGSLHPPPVRPLGAGCMAAFRADSPSTVNVRLSAIRKPADKDLIPRELASGIGCAKLASSRSSGCIASGSARLVWRRTISGGPSVSLSRKTPPRAAPGSGR